MSFHSATSRLGVDVCLTLEEAKDVPECPHGPMLLFERFFKDGRSPRKFFACSACRDRKDCAFFQWEDEKLTDVRRQTHQNIIEASIPSLEKWKFNKGLKKLMSSSEKNKDWLYCHSCNLLVIESNRDEHEDHDVEKGEKLEELRNPSFILKPMENQKAHAQYMFSPKSTRFLLTTIQKLGFKKVLCLGTPRIHEKIQLDSFSKKEGESVVDSLLLDIDYRYGQFYPSSKFCWYNMFNNYFFNNEESKKTLLHFIQSTNSQEIVLVMDPPFGGLVKVLAVTVKKIWELWRQECTIEKTDEKEMPTLWIFPYFMESHIQESLPSLKMMDYKAGQVSVLDSFFEKTKKIIEENYRLKFDGNLADNMGLLYKDSEEVDYDNHPHFKGKQAHGSKRGSPVRIFTNINAAEIKLPAHDGYRFCKPCQRFVAAENAHCTKCNACTSKDGRRYVHCDDCDACVKPGRVHCAQCLRCEVSGHDCSRSSTSGCHICGELNHKRRECPQRARNDGKTDKATLEEIRSSQGGAKRRRKRMKQTPTFTKKQKTDGK